MMTQSRAPQGHHLCVWCACTPMDIQVWNTCMPCSVSLAGMVKCNRVAWPGKNPRSPESWDDNLLREQISTEEKRGNNHTVLSTVFCVRSQETPRSMQDAYAIVQLRHHGVNDLPAKFRQNCLDVVRALPPSKDCDVAPVNLYRAYTKLSLKARLKGNGKAVLTPPLESTQVMLIRVAKRTIGGSSGYRGPQCRRRL